MQNNLYNFIQNKKQEGSLGKQSEEATKQGLILPVLQQLGWNPFDVQEVFPEYSVQSGRVDYALRINGYNKVFIEVKKVGEDLEKHQGQLLRYAFDHGVKLAILTNGILWWFYLPLQEGTWEQRRFYTVDLLSQSPSDITDKFFAFISKNDVVSGQAITNADNVYNSRQKGKIIGDTFPKAWRKLLSEEDDLLIEVVAESVEKICGYKPDSKTVINFLKEMSGETNLPQPVKKDIQKTSKIETGKSNDDETKVGNSQSSSVPNLPIAFSKPTSFSFCGENYEVTDWVSLLKSFINALSQKHTPDELNKLTKLVGKRRPYFTTDSTLLRKPGHVNNTNLYFETHYSAASIKQFIGQILNTMRYSADAVSIKTTHDL